MVRPGLEEGAELREAAPQAGSGPLTRRLLQMLVLHTQSPAFVIHTQMAFSFLTLGTSCEAV